MSTENPQHDLLIVHGKNWNRHRFNSSKPIELSDASKINALAAARAYELGLARTILFSTGETLKGQPSEARAMFEYLRGTGHAIPESAVLFQEKSFDTETEAEENKKIIEQLGAINIAAGTVSDHGPRVEDIYASKGIHVTSYDSEILAAELGPYYAEKVANYKQSPARQVIRAQEWLLQKDRKIGTKGKLPTWLASRSRH